MSCLRPSGTRARRHDADRLPFQHREHRAAERQHDVTDIAPAFRCRDAEIALHRGDRRLVATIEIDRGLGGRGRRHRLAADAGVRLGEQRIDLVLDRLRRRRGGLADILLRRQLAPAELLVERIGARDHAPVVDRAGRAGRDAVHAEIALGGVDHVVAVVVRDRADRARRLAGIAADADLGIDEMLLLVRGCGRIHARVLPSGYGSRSSARGGRNSDR